MNRQTGPPLCPPSVDLEASEQHGQENISDQPDDATIFSAFQSSIESSMKLMEQMTMDQKNLAIESLQKLLAMQGSSQPADLQLDNSRTSQPADLQRENSRTSQPADLQRENSRTSQPADLQLDNKRTSQPADLQLDNSSAENSDFALNYELPCGSKTGSDENQDKPFGTFTLHPGTRCQSQSGCEQPVSGSSKLELQVSSKLTPETMATDIESCTASTEIVGIKTGKENERQKVEIETIHVKRSLVQSKEVSVEHIIKEEVPEKCSLPVPMRTRAIAQQDRSEKSVVKPNTRSKGKTVTTPAGKEIKPIQQDRCDRKVDRKRRLPCGKDKLSKGKNIKVNSPIKCEGETSLNSPKIRTCKRNEDKLSASAPPLSKKEQGPKTRVMRSLAPHDSSDSFKEEKNRSLADAAEPNSERAVVNSTKTEMESESFTLYIDLNGNQHDDEREEVILKEIKEEEDQKKIRHSKRGQVHTCTACGLEFPTKSKLSGHSQVHWEVKCEQCLRMFKSERSLQRHVMLSHSKINKDKSDTVDQKDVKHCCAKCGKCFRRQSNLEAHMAEHTESKAHTCIHCGRTFAFLNNLTRHLMLHNGERPHGCQQCDARFIERKSLLTHMESQHGVVGRPREKHAFTCALCNKEFSSSGTLQQHMLVHTGEKKFACTICGKGFSLNSNRKRHERTHTGDRPFKCPDCGNTFTEKRSMEIHRRKHTGEKPYKCKICGRTFSQSGTLASHMPVHNKVRNLLCTLCGLSFLRRSHLTFHMKKHTEAPKYQCSDCSMAFYRSFDLVRHKQAHDRIRPYSCPDCPKKFSRRAYLTKHSLSHTENRIYPCTKCDKVFDIPGERYRHIRSAHPRPRLTLTASTVSQEPDQLSLAMRELPISVQNVDSIGGAIELMGSPDRHPTVVSPSVQFTVNEDGRAVILKNEQLHPNQVVHVDIDPAQQLGSQPILNMDHNKILESIAVSMKNEEVATVPSASSATALQEMFTVTDTGLVAMKTGESDEGHQFSLPSEGATMQLSEADASTQALLEEALASQSGPGQEVHVQTIDLEQGVAVTKTYVVLVKKS